jgi:hypothetical protein
MMEQTGRKQLQFYYCSVSFEPTADGQPILGFGRFHIWFGSLIDIAGKDGLGPTFEQPPILF